MVAKRSRRLASPVLLLTLAVCAAPGYAGNTWELLNQPNAAPFADGMLHSLTQHSLSDDGSRAVFQSDATNLVGGRPVAVGGPVSYLRDRGTGETSYVSDGLRQAPWSGVAKGTYQSISGDGRWVAFSSDKELVSGVDAQFGAYPYVLDLETGAMFFAGAIEPGSPQQLFNPGPVIAGISDDGRYTLLRSSASHVLQDDDGGADDAYLFDRDANELILVTAGGAFEPSAPYVPLAMSGDASIIALATLSDIGALTLHLLDRVTGQIETPAVPAGLNPLLSVNLSDDGRWFSFVARAYDAEGDELVGPHQGFLHDRERSTTVELNVLAGIPDADLQLGAMSGDGRFLVVSSSDSGLPTLGAGAPGDGALHAYRWDRTTGLFELVSEIDGQPANGMTTVRDATPSGSTFVVITKATNILNGDTNGIADLYFVERPIPQLGDLDGDGAVSAPDLAILIGLWGSNGLVGDFDGDGSVGQADLAVVLGNWSTGG